LHLIHYIVTLCWCTCSVWSTHTNTGHGTKTYTC